MKRRVISRWIACYAFGVVWLALMVGMTAVRLQDPPLGLANDLTVGIVIMCAVFVVLLVICLVLVVRPSRARARLRRENPAAFVQNARRDGFRPIFDADPEMPALRDISYFITVVASDAGLAVWDSNEEIAKVFEIPWAGLGKIEKSATYDTLPQWMVKTNSTWKGQELHIELVFTSEICGGIFPQSEARCDAAIDALNQLRMVAAKRSRD
ncbi:hypothetical protein IT072_16720 [Leifsonia sp. ZF2019]|uniref:hypothetical protein n=1 Tax=Leifsonia sp. ZF2019 TaxID=2781978 RepID=UPI001CBCBF87|nr:hypothetical protein [Leifsonia sp. ZF2019]UAJ78850.1 hypothetical protein IT072_16720 [Leifsonia sp. ZF2019]